MDEEGHDYANAAFFSRAYENLQRNLTSDQGTLVILNLLVGEAGGGGKENMEHCAYFRNCNPWCNHHPRYAPASCLS